MPTQKKIETVKTLKEKLNRTKALFIADYRGLSHQQLESLRKTLKKVEAEFVVVKNTLLKLALEKEPIQQSLGQASKDETKKLAEELKNPSAALFTYGDEIAAIKALSNFIKNAQLPKIKIGLYEGKIAGEADFHSLASLPTRGILLATLMVRMKSPIYGLHYALSWHIQRFVRVLGNIKDKKPQPTS